MFRSRSLVAIISLITILILAPLAQAAVNAPKLTTIDGPLDNDKDKVVAPSETGTDIKTSSAATSRSDAKEIKLARAQDTSASGDDTSSNDEARRKTAAVNAEQEVFAALAVGCLTVLLVILLVAALGSTSSTSSY